MTPQELKNSILQLAIQGKLVEQRPEEGTAEELFREIQKEKQALIKAGKIKKEKPLPEITEEELPFDIPETWKWVYIGEVFLHNTGKAQNASGSSAGTLRRFITTSNLYWNEFDFSKVKEMPFTEQEIERCSARKGDLLVCEGGDCGRSAIWRYDEEVCIQNHVHRLRPYSAVSIEYFYYVFFLYKFTGRLRGRGVAIQGLSSEAIHKVICPLPPLAEQKRIVAKIEELLPLIDRYEKAWTRLEDFNKRFPGDMQKSILQMAIQGKLVEQRPEEGTREELYQQIQKEKQALIKAGKIKAEKAFDPITDDEMPFDIPSNWTWVRFGELGSYKKGPFGSALTKSMFVPKGPNSVKVYEQKNAIQKDASLGEYYIRRDYFESKMSGFEVHPGDVIVSCAGTIGETYVLPECIEQGIINQALMRMQIFAPMFIPYFLTFFDVVLKQSARANSKGSAIKNIPPFEILKNYLVPLPPLAEQKRIVARLEELLPLCEKLK